MQAEFGGGVGVETVGETEEGSEGGGDGGKEGRRVVGGLGRMDVY